MLTTPSTARRIAGKALIALTAAAALPLTASRATEYVDVPAPARPAGTAVPAAAVAPVRISAPLASAAVVSAPAPAAPGELPYPDLGNVSLGKNSLAFMGDDTILIDGTRKNLEQLSPAQRSRLRATILKSQAELAKERAELPGRLAEAQHELERVRSGEFKRELLRDREDLKRDLAEISSEAAELRAEGEDPAERKAEILADLRELDTMDIDKLVGEALQEANPARIAAELRSAEEQMARLLARLDQLDRR